MGLEVSIGQTVLQNPVCVASGTFGYAKEMADLVDLDRIGAVFTKAVTKQKRDGNPIPRITETNMGMLNAIGLANVGVENFISEKMEFLRKIKAKVFVNVAGSDISEYEYVVKRLEDCSGIDGYEINISCPNVKKGGMSFADSVDSTEKVVKKIRKITQRTLIVKLSPNVKDISEYAYASQEEGADSVSLINTLVGMSVDIYTKKPRLANITGGLSGPAIKPVGIAMVYKTFKKISIPIFGIGGISNTMDALEYIIAGASAVQIGTANFVDPKTSENIVFGLTDYLKNNGIENIKNLTGSIICD